MTYRLSNAPGWFSSLGMGIVLSAIFVFVLGLPAFHYGLWQRIEPVSLGVQAVGLLGCLWLALGIGRRWLVFEKRYHPFLLLYLAWLGWQGVATVLADSPMRSWLGLPELGDGLAQNLCIFILFLLAHALWQNLLWRRLMLWSAALSVLALCYLHFDLRPLCPLYATHYASDADVPIPIRWGDYLGFLALWLWMAFALSGKAQTPRAHCCFITVASLAVFISDNKAASFLVPLALAGGSLFHLLRAQRWLTIMFTPGRFWRALAIIGCLLPLAWFFVSQKPQWAAQRECNSLHARAALNQVSANAMRNEPSRFFAGNGWGTFANDSIKYILIEGVHIYHDGKYAPNWPSGTVNYAMHSHNQAAEALLATGLPGLALWLALPLVALWHLPRRHFWKVAPALVALVWMSHVWFLVTLTAAFQSLFLAGLYAALPKRPWPKTWPAASRSLPWLAASAILAATCAYNWRAMSYGETLQQALYKKPYRDIDPAWLASDIDYGGWRLWRVATHNFTQDFIAGNRFDVRNIVGWYTLLIDASYALIKEEKSGALVSAGAVMLENMMATLEPGVMDSLRNKALLQLADTVPIIARKAPLREDMAAPFLEAISSNDQNIPQKIDFLTGLLRIAPQHRGAMWLLGKYMLASPEHEATGGEMMREALKLGADRVYPITLHEIEALKNQTACESPKCSDHH